MGETPYRKLFTSDYVLDEAITTCRTRTRSHRASVELGTFILASKSIVLLRVDDDVLNGSWKTYKERDDVELSFTDCTTAFLAKTHGIIDLFTYDADLQALNLHTVSKL